MDASLKTFPILVDFSHTASGDTVTRSLRNFNECVRVGERVVLQSTSGTREAIVTEDEQGKSYTTFTLV